MKTEARYAIDGKTHYSVMKEIPVPKELNRQQKMDCYLKKKVGR